MIDPGKCFNKIAVHRVGDGWEATWRVDDTLPYFAGHFPDQAVLPAVAMVDAAEIMAANALNVRLRFREIVSCKFMRPIFPGQLVHIKLQKSSEDDAAWNLEWWINDGETRDLATSLSLLLDRFNGQTL